jgi:protein-disulfide isomerase
VWRHLPLTDVHVHAQRAAEAAEAAPTMARSGRCTSSVRRPGALHVDDLGYAEQQKLDVERFASDLRKGVGGARVADDIDGADLSGFNGTLTFIHERPLRRLDIETLSQAVRAAGARAMFAQT